MRSILLILLTAAAPIAPVCSLHAQRLLTADQNCPVGIMATRQATGSTVFTNTTPRDPASQGVHLTLTPRDSNIASAEIVVHALTYRTRAIPVAPHTSDTIQKTFTLQSTGRAILASDLWINRTSGIQTLDLISLTYTDGTTWHATADTPCRIEPSGVVLVANK